MICCLSKHSHGPAHHDSVTPARYKSWEGGGLGFLYLCTVYFYRQQARFGESARFWQAYDPDSIPLKVPGTGRGGTCPMISNGVGNEEGEVAKVQSSADPESYGLGGQGWHM